MSILYRRNPGETLALFRSKKNKEKRVRVKSVAVVAAVALYYVTEGAISSTGR